MPDAAPDELSDHDELSELLGCLGLTPGRVLGSGIEGTVIEISDELVAKVWRHRHVADVRRLAGFYDAVAAAGPRLAMPHIEQVLEVEDVVVSLEARLPGQALWVADGSSPELGPAEVDALVEALGALAAIPGSRELRSLPVLPDEPALPGVAPFADELGDLVVRRVSGSRALLTDRLPDLDDVASGVTQALRSLSPVVPTLVHGDLIAANVLAVDGRATAVVDFGFLSTVGDPAFDAAVATSCFDMYGPRAREVERALELEVVDAFGHDAARLATYRAAYALATATCFSPDGTDGHFDWCLAMLARPDVREAVR